jgi:hypothetical protein
VPALAATSADGQNLRPDIAQQLEAIADEAKGRIDSMVKENKVSKHPFKLPSLYCNMQEYTPLQIG